MKIARSSLVGRLLEIGEEDIAVLLARSALSDELDIDRDAGMLANLGLDRDDLLTLLPAVPGGPAPSDPHTEGRRRVTAATISDRWADLVSQWTTASVPGAEDAATSR